MADDKHLVCLGATVYCNNSLTCNNPGTAVPLNITSQTLVVINGGKLAATDKDNSIVNMNFGSCITRNNAPCTAQVQWTKVYQDADVAGTLKLLTEESEGLCTCGGGKIKIARHGQIATPQSIEMEEVSEEILGQIVPLNKKDSARATLQDAGISSNVMSLISKKNNDDNGDNAQGADSEDDSLKDLKPGDKFPGWKKGCDYSMIKNPKSATAYMNFTKSQKQQIYDINRKAHKGYLVSDLDGTILEAPQKSVKGVTPSQFEAQVDHITAKSKGGANTGKNAQVLSRQQNRAKWDK